MKLKTTKRYWSHHTKKLNELFGQPNTSFACKIRYNAILECGRKGEGSCKIKQIRGVEIPEQEKS